jgi:D-lactate dehydrogenase
MHTLFEEHKYIMEKTYHQPISPDSSASPVQALATTIDEEEGQYLLEHLGAQLSLKLTTHTLQEIDEQQLAQVEILMPFIHPHIGRAEMEAMPRLKLIATRSTGYDHIDLDYAREHNITVCNVPGYGETAVAEYTLALILTLSRKVHQAYARMQQGNFSLDGLRGFDLYNKTLGVVGAGAIGLHVVRIARGFGMQVIAYDVQQNRLLSEVLGFRYADLDELLANSDIVSLHAPAIPSTFHLINRETLSKMKRGALLINTARGSLVDTEALAWALDTGLLAGAGLDVMEGEELLQHEEELLRDRGSEDKLRLLVHHHVLQRRNNVVITTIENVQAFLAGHAQHTC